MKALSARSKSPSREPAKRYPRSTPSCVRYGLVVWTGGNVSGRVPGADVFVIRPSGVSYDDLSPENMIVCDLDGVVIPEHCRQRTRAVERHRRARLRLPQHAPRRRRRPHPLHLRHRVGRSRRRDTVRDPRAWPTSSVAPSRSALRASSATTRSVAASCRPSPVTARVPCSCRITARSRWARRPRRGQGCRDGRGCRAHRAARARGWQPAPLPQDAIDSLFDRYQNVYGQAAQGALT